MEGKNNKGSWFDDDPEWAELRNRIEGQPTPKPKKRPDTKHKQEKPPQASQNAPDEPKKVEVSVNFTLPKVKLPTPPKISKKQLVIGGGVAGSLVLLFVGYKVISGVVQKTDKPTTDGTAQQVTQPTFDTVLPDGKTEATSSGRVGYDSKRQVASFEDTIGMAKLTVSQQPLPENFKANPDEEVRKLAEGFGATEVIAESSPKAYLGTDEKGPQTAIFHKNGLLIFILSSKTLDKSQWAEYVTKLQ